LTRKVADVAADVLAGTGAGVDEEDRAGN